jgi:hypothetical protein
MKFPHKLLFALATLTGLLLASGGEPVSQVPDAKKPFNIGFAIYTKGEVPGTLNAKWNYANIYHGPGVATGGPKEGFAGHYHIRYYYENGEFSDEYDLVIEKTGESYNVTWISHGKVRARGVGTEVEHRLAVGWRRVDD